MALPKELIASLAGIPGFNQKTFEEIHASGEQITSIRINPGKTPLRDGEWVVKESVYQSSLITQKVPWCATGFYLAQRPSFTFDPLFHAGCYYVQEASGMFMEQALTQTVDLSRPLKVLDLCAAPGGKSTHLQSLLSSESLLVSNEVIKSRAGILKQNIIKWGCRNVLVTNNDPQHFSKLKGFFDVMVADAPCSGSGLFRKDEEAVKEWSEENVLLCCGRQKRIIADALAALKENGILIYSTCSYSKEENEDIADWLVTEMNLHNLPLTIKKEWGIVESVSDKTKAKGYRFFPDKVKGEGFYLACFLKTTETETPKYKPVRPETAHAKEKSIIEPWLNNQDILILKEHSFYALPAVLLNDYSWVKSNLNILYAGTAVGEIMKERLIPEHALALSSLVAASVPRLALDYPEAVRYLQKQDMALNTNGKGWQITTFQQRNLGWINALPGRINNYYPKELRILKQ
jgi:16S rRNA C967 or C1407 C5-methylase (RsmB/RsmF family)/NOL1/NOP2/fmu family ribosome biogenesis protein